MDYVSGRLVPNF